MIENITSSEISSDRIKLPFHFDVEKMINDIENLNLHQFAYYDAIPLRSPAHMVDPSLPIPPPANDYADGSWTPWLNTKALENAPYLTEIVNTFAAHTKVTLVRLLRLEKGATVKEHTDPTLGLHIEKSVIRLTIPILTNDKVDFFLNGTTVPMKPGECWYLNLTDPHRVVNDGDSDRINMSVDMLPNDWVRSMIKDAE